MINLSDLPYSSLRRFLLNLKFAEKIGPTGAHVFEHVPSDTAFIFRAYQPDEMIYWPDLIHVRTHLDARGLLPADSFDQLLRKTSA
jgi:hypothetical protein